MSRINKKVGLFLLGVMLMLWGVMCIIPAFVAWYYDESEIKIFLLTIVFFVTIGLCLTWFARSYSQMIGKREGQMYAGFIWFLVPLLGSLPYLFFPEVFSLMDAVFESYSGFTTTGSTIIDDLDEVPRSVLAYRSMTQWIGGLGFGVLIIFALKKFPVSLINLFNAEFFSINSEKIYPKLRDTVKIIISLYLLLTIVEFVLLMVGGMDFENALCHSFSTISTGGFSTQNANVGAFDAYSQIVITVFMFLSGISFFLIVNFFRGKWKSVFKDEQLRYYVLLIIVVSLGFALYWSVSGNMTWTQKIKDSLFYSISIISTTGYDIQISSPGTFVSACLICMMFIGGMSASSATGLKIIRVLMLYRYAKVAMVKIFHPNVVMPVKYNKHAVPEGDIRRIFGFFFLYILTFMIGVFLLCLFGNDFRTSLAMSAANLSNIGAIVGGYLEDFSYAFINMPSQVVLIVLMMMGRLEIYSFLALFSRK